MIHSQKTTKANKNVVEAFRAYLQTVITAEQFGIRDRLAALPGSKTVNFCVSLAGDSENTLANELAAPVWAILGEIEKTAMDYHRPLFHKTVKDPATQARYEEILWQLDFALALIQRRFASLVRFRAKNTKCSDLLCDTLLGMLQGDEAAKLLRRWEKFFHEECVREADGSILDGGFPDDFAWDTYRRVEVLNDLADEFPDSVKPAAKRMHGWPMLVHRHSNNRKRFDEMVKRFELGVDYPLDASDAARFRPDSPMVRYLDPLMCKLMYVRQMTVNSKYETVEQENKILRQWLWDFQDEMPADEEVGVAKALRDLPPLIKSTANKWAEMVVVPIILATDARDWKNSTESVLQRIAKQKGVKSRATFKSRLLSSVSSTLRRLAREN